jgi:hypothetical protein
MRLGIIGVISLFLVIVSLFPHITRDGLKIKKKKISYLICIFNLNEKPVLHLKFNLKT